MNKITVNGIERDETPEEAAERLSIFASFEPIDPLTVAIPAAIFWAAVEDLLGLTKYGIMGGVMASTVLSEPEKMDAIINMAAQGNYRWEDGNFQKLLPLFGYPAEQAADLWAYMVEHYLNG